jgi:hypothetical protein
MKRSSLLTIIISALVILGIVIYLARPRAEEADNVQPRQPVVATQPTFASGSVPPALVSCVGPINPQSPIASLEARHRWANSLLLANHPDGALSELRDISTLDPGYPAINIDISDALLKSKHASEAKDAIKLQLEISECLANLPQPDMLAYCKSEWASLPEGGCVPELDKINQKAHYEAGVVDTELARGVEARSATIAANVAPEQPKRVAVSASIAPAASTAAPPVVQKMAPATAPVETAAVASPPPLAPPVPPVNIKSTEATEHIGQLATVCGEIASKHTAEESNGKPTFVNFDHAFPNPSFTAVIWGSDGPAVGDFPEAGNVCVTGTISTYRGSPEIVVHDAKSWRRSDEQ